jgi:hypothetical protein
MENEGIGVAQTLGMLRETDVDCFDTGSQWFHDSEKQRIAQDERQQRARHDRNIGQPI